MRESGYGQQRTISQHTSAIWRIVVPSAEINEITQREWRELGYFYDRDDAAREWKLMGSRAGLRNFSIALQAYALDMRNESLSEHEHFGPYGYLEIGTWTTPEITEHWIAGSLGEIHQLGLTIQAHLDFVPIGECFRLRATFAPRSPYELVLEVQANSFDPAKADAYCW